MLTIANLQLSSRLIINCPCFDNLNLVAKTVLNSHCELVCLPAKKIDTEQLQQPAFAQLLAHNINFLPSTIATQQAQEVVQIAKHNKEVLGTHLIRLNLCSAIDDPLIAIAALIKSCETLSRMGFAVIPCIPLALYNDFQTADAPDNHGAAAIILQSNEPISAQTETLEPLLAKSKLPIIVDANAATANDAALAAQLGATAVLVSSAVDSITMMHQLIDENATLNQQAC